MPPAIKGELSLSPKAEKLFNNANVLARQARDQKVTTRYLLLSMIDDPHVPLVRALKGVGVNVESLKKDASEKPADVET